ncbi:MAG: YihY/virulence factor BrkB family protein [Gemmatimonadota bacterium]|nr:YihY/virulence factor BrkB family protein [Gemmatimonadota bacterium]
MDTIERWARGAARWVAFYGRNLWRKASRDQILFLASGITFNVLVTIVPLLLISISILGYAIDSPGEAREQVLGFIQRVMPLATAEAESLLFSLVEDRGKLLGIGLVWLVWAASRLFGSLRTVLEVVFEIPPEDRLGIVEGKIHDLKLVVVVGTLFVLSISLTTGLRWVKNYGVSFLGIDPFDVSWVTAVTSVLVAFTITVAMFYFVYRYAPDRWIPRTDALIAAVFSGVLFELAKQGFVAYLAEFGRFMKLYGSFTNIVVVAFWVYYSSVVFMLGGEIARIVQVQRGRGSEPGWEIEAS